MKILLRLLLFAGIAAVAYWSWIHFFPNPKAVIRQRLKTLSELASSPGNEGNLSRLTHVQRLGTFFSDDIQVMVDIPGVERTFAGREELMQAALSVKGMSRSFKAELVGLNIELNPDNKSALVDCTLKAKIGNENDLIVQELKFTLKVIDGTWLITRIETVKTLSP